VNEHGCRETKQTHAFSQLCPAEDEDCKLHPPSQKGRRIGDWKRLAKPFGSKDPRIQQAWFALQYARAQNWLGAAMMFCAVDLLGKPMHVSYFCQTQRRDFICWSPEHAGLETFTDNLGRVSHQNDKDVCDCAENSRPSCIINGANMPIRDKETGKTLRWVPGPREGLGQAAQVSGDY
jgi:hypothetical protein